MIEQQKIVAAYIDKHKESAFLLLEKMVQEASVQFHEKDIQNLVIKKLEELKLEIDVWEPQFNDLKDSPYFVSPRNDFNNSPNVVGVLKGKGGGKSLILNGHIDVVPEGDRTKWNLDPFSGVTENGKMYGRGTTDMKGGNVSLLFAMEAIIKSGIKLKGDVIFQSVIEEESGGAGTLATVQRGYKADAAIIPEPTNMKLFIKQQGSLWFRITVEGLSAHGGTRYEGVSAIEKAWVVHKAILNLESERNKKIKDPLFDSIPIPIPINVGKIEGGSWPSSVPDLVTMEGRLGVGPDESIDDAKQAMQDCVNRIATEDDWFEKHPVQLEFFGAQWVPNAVKESHSFVNLVKENYEQLFQENVTIEASPWGTDAGILGAAGGIPAIVIGPGETKVAHFPNEFIKLDEVIRAAKLFAVTILKWCEEA